MEFFLTFLLIFFGVIWFFGKFFPRLLAWYIQRRLKKMGGGGNSFGSFNWANGGEEAARRVKEEEMRRSKEQEGNVTVVQSQEQEKIIEKNIGEYIDFEEDKDDGA
ncbi:MAG: DUF4834 family protein [Bacteroidales bacterium]